MSSSVILGTARTPVGKMGGALASLEAPELGGIAIEAALERSGVGAEQVQQVIFGQVLQAGQGQIPSRQAQIKGGIPKEVPSETINKVCASGMRTLGLADQAIRVGDLDVAVTGGMESMSKAPYLLPNARFGFRMGDVAGARRDDPRRAHQPLHRQADDQRGLRGLQRARDHPRRHGQIRGPLAAAGGRGDRGRPDRRRDRPGRRQGPQGRHHGRGRRGAAPGHDAGGAGEAEGGRRRGRDPHRRQRARASTTGPARSSSPPRSGPRRKAASRSPRSSPTRWSPTTSPTSPAPPATRR